MGGHVRKGEESTIIVFWKVEDLKQSSEDLDTEGKRGQEPPPPFAPVLSRFRAT